MPVNIIQRSSIQSINSITVNGDEHYLGEHRDFRRNETLNSFLENTSRCSLSWVKLKSGESLAPHTHTTRSMIIITKGKAMFTGDYQNILVEGDVIAVGAGDLHGFSACLGEDMEGLSVQFEGKGLYEDISNPRASFVPTHSKSIVIDENEKRKERFKEIYIFDLFRSGYLNNEENKNRFFSIFKVWSRNFQKLIFARQAATNDKEMQDLFLQHFYEELGHDKLLDKHKVLFEKDSILNAGSSWFFNKMLLGDDIEKWAVMHLSIEGSADIFHENLSEATQKKNKDGYLESHLLHDHDHSLMGQHLLDDLSRTQCEKLVGTINESWDMIELILNRIAELSVKNTQNDV
jgi:quercetin dioxygenase-like cupin family protein